MADLNFPQNPSPGDTYSIGSRTWIWNGSGWALQSGIISTNPFIVVSAQITTTTNSTSTVSGALVVAGGAGFGGDIWANAIYSGGSQVITTASIGNFGVSAVQAGTDTAVAFLPGNVALVWNTSTLESVTGRGSITPNAIEISNTTNSTGTTSGALLVGGGVGIGKNLYVGETLTVSQNGVFGSALANNITVSGSTSSNAVKITANGSDSSVGVDLETKNNSTVRITSTLSSSTTANNALYVVGGLGVEKSIYADQIFDNSNRVLTKVNPAAGTAISIGSVTTSNGVVSFTVNNEGVTSLNGSDFLGVSAVVGNITLTNLGVQSAVGSTYLGVSSSTGTVTFTNLGVQTLTAGTDTAVSASTGTVTVWNNSTLQSVTDRGAATTNSITITSTTGSSTSTQGALVVNGGVGVGQNLNVGGTLNVWGPATFSAPVTFSGTATFVYSTNTVYTDNLLELHTQPNGNWTFDDGKDIGLRFSYYNRTLVTGTSAALVLSNATQELEFYSSGAESNTGTFINATFGVFRTGAIALVNTTANAQNTNSGALTVAGGVGVGGTQFIGGVGGTGNSTAVAQQALIVNANGIGINGNSYFANNVGIGGTINVTGASTLSSLNVNSTATLNGSVTANSLGVTNNFNVTGTSVLSGNVTAGADVNVTGNLNVTGTTTVSGPIRLENATDSAGTNSGALIVSGGAGFGGNVNVGGNIFVNGTINATVVGVISTATNLAAGAAGAIPYQTGFGQTSFTGVGTSGDVLVSRGAGQPAFVNTLTLAGTTNATSTLTGAFVTLGGAGIGRDLWVGGALYVGGNQAVTTGTIGELANLTVITAGTDTAVSTSTGNVTIWNTSTLQSITDRGAETTNAVKITNTTASTSTNSGALTVTGGVGVGGNLFVGGIVTATVLRTLSTSIQLGANSTATNSSSVAIGDTAWANSIANTAVGNQAFSNGIGATAYGNGSSAVGTNAIAIGSIVNANGIGAVVIGNNAYASANSISIGSNTAGLGEQGGGSVAIGDNAVAFYQGNRAIAIGYRAGYTFQTTGSIILSAGNSYIDSANNAGLYISPIRADASSSATTWSLFYNPVTKEITTATSSPYTGIFTITNVTPSIGTNSGALQVVGGVGVGGSVNVGGSINANGNINTGGNLGVQGNFNTTGTSTLIGAVTAESTLGVRGNFNVTGTTTFSGSVNVGPAAQVSSYASGSTSTTATIYLDSFAVSEFRTAKYLVQVVDTGATPNKVHSAELLVFHDNNGVSTQAYIVQYGIATNTGELGTWDANYNSGNIVLEFTPNYIPGALTVKTVRTGITT